MRLFNLFKGSSLSPLWRFSLDGVVWRIYPTESGLVIGEERDPEKKTVGFFCLDGSKGTPLWQKKSYGEQWWIGIELVYCDVVVLHRFAAPDLPEHRGIIVVDLTSGDELWRNETAKFIAAHADGFLLALGGSLALETAQVHYRTGLTLAEPAYNGDQYKNSSTAASARESNALQFASPVRNLASPEARAAVNTICSSPSLYGEPLALDAGNCLIVAWWEEIDGSTPEHPHLRGEIGIVDRVNGALLYDGITDPSLTGIVPDPFVVRDGSLYYVRERSTLIAVRF